MEATYCGGTYCFEPKGLVSVCSTLLSAFSAILPVETTHGRDGRVYCLFTCQKVRGESAPSELDSSAILR